MPTRTIPAAPVDPERLLALVARFTRSRIAVVGDLLADEFIYGRVERVSREAPVLILALRLDDRRAGRRGQRCEQRRLARRAGAPRRGRRPRRGGPPDDRGAPRTGHVAERGQPQGYATPVKTRILAGGVHSAKQQVVRIDRGVANGAPGPLRGGRVAALAALSADAVLVSDYGSAS